MKIQDCLVTVVVSVATTLFVTRSLQPPQGNHLQAAAAERLQELVVDRLIVREELIVSDTEKPWDEGFEEHQIPRGIVVRSLAPRPDGQPGAAGLWVRGRLIKTEIDDPFDDRFHAINRDGSMFRAPGHMSWNVWLDGAWRQAAILQGEILERSEVPDEAWSGGNHPGRMRFQTFRPNHSEPLTDVIIGQGKMSIGGGGYGGGGLPYPVELLELWGGKMSSHAVATPAAPRLIRDDGSGNHVYALIAVGPQGERSGVSEPVAANGLATLEWDSVAGADAYIVVRNGKEIEQLWIEGSNKTWSDDVRHRFKN